MCSVYYNCWRGCKAPTTIIQLEIWNRKIFFIGCQAISKVQRIYLQVQRFLVSINVFHGLTSNMNKAESNEIHTWAHTHRQSNLAVIRDPMYTNINYTNFQITLKLITNDRTGSVVCRCRRLSSTDTGEVRYNSRNDEIKEMPLVKWVFEPGDDYCCYRRLWLPLRLNIRQPNSKTTNDVCSV